jgi:hypothetical protein
LSSIRPDVLFTKRIFLFGVSVFGVFKTVTLKASKSYAGSFFVSPIYKSSGALTLNVVHVLFLSLFVLISCLGSFLFLPFPFCDPLSLCVYWVASSYFRFCWACLHGSPLFHACWLVAVMLSDVKYSYPYYQVICWFFPGWLKSYFS